jgi:hypothetical protein
MIYHDLKTNAFLKQYFFFFFGKVICISLRLGSRFTLQFGNSIFISSYEQNSRLTHSVM